MACARGREDTLSTRTIGAPLIEAAAAVDRPKVRLSEYGFTVLQIETLLACNMACSFCAYPLLEDKGARLDDATVLRLLDQVDPDDPEFEYVCFSHYNEPLLDDRVFDFLRAARERGLKTLLITNGLALRSPETVERLLSAEPDFIKISFQTASRHKFYQSRGTGISYEKYALTVIDFLRVAQERGGRTKVTVDFACNFMPWYQRLIRGLLGVEAGDPSVRHDLTSLSPYVVDCVE
ncbi:MAG: radical SAM protein, partial [Actinobacteria bacterium]